MVDGNLEAQKRGEAPAADIDAAALQVGATACAERRDRSDTQVLNCDSDIYGKSVESPKDIAGRMISILKQHGNLQAVSDNAEAKEQFKSTMKDAFQQGGMEKVQEVMQAFNKDASASRVPYSIHPTGTPLYVTDKGRLQLSFYLNGRLDLKAFSVDVGKATPQDIEAQKQRFAAEAKERQRVDEEQKKQTSSISENRDVEKPKEEKDAPKTPEQLNVEKLQSAVTARLKSVIEAGTFVGNTQKLDQDVRALFDMKGGGFSALRAAVDDANTHSTRVLRAKEYSDPEGSPDKATYWKMAVFEKKGPGIETIQGQYFVKLSDKPIPRDHP